MQSQTLRMRGLEFTAQAILPEGWRLVTPALPFRLSPRESEIRIVSFFIPQTAPARKHEIVYRVNAVKYPSISDSAAAYVAVLASSNLQVQLIEAPETIIAGDEYIARFLITNASNSENRVVVKVRGSQDQAFTFTPDTMVLSPGESSEVSVDVKTDEKRRDSFKHHLEVTARSAENQEMIGQASCAVDVIPRVTGEMDRFHRIPSRIVLRSPVIRGEMESARFQAEFSGEGPLSEDGDDEITFMFRGPDTLEDNAVFGDHDGYFAGYRNNRADFLVGDGYFSLSKLTEQSLDGRGVKGGLALGDFGLNGYYMNSRWLDPEERTGALHLDYRCGDRYRIGANLFTKNSELQDARIASIQGLLTPLVHANIGFEAAHGRDDNTRGNAYWLSIFGSPRWGSYRLEYIRAEPDFPGYYQDIEYISGNLFLPIMRRLTLNATLRQEKDNLDIDPRCESANMNRYGLLGLNYAFDSGTTVTLESRYSTREDRFPTPMYDDRDLTLKARLGQRFRSTYFSLSAEMGNALDRLGNQTTTVGIYEATGYFMPTPKQTYGGYVRYGNHDDPENPGGEVLNAGLTASLQLWETTQLYARVELYNDLDSAPGDRHTLDAGVSHLFPNGWIASVQGRHILYSDHSGQEDETAIIAELTIPFGLPVGRKKSIGMLGGRVLNNETGEPMPDAILRLNGAAAVTDGNGEFSFPAVTPGTFHLDVDTASIGLERIPVQKTPMEVAIRGGEETSLDIGVTRSAGLTGRVMVYDFAKTDHPTEAFRAINGEGRPAKGGDKGEMTEAHGLANTLVELAAPAETLRVLTDGKGRFGFNGVRPGTWTVTIRSDSLPQHHYLEKDRFEVDLTPGDHQEMLIQVLPQNRVIQIIEEGATVIEE